MRHRLGLTQEAMALQLGVSVVHLSNIENDKAMPSASLLDRFREVSGVDIYVLDWCERPNLDELPKALRNAANKLRELWLEQVNAD